MGALFWKKVSLPRKIKTALDIPFTGNPFNCHPYFFIHKIPL